MCWSGDSGDGEGERPEPAGVHGQRAMRAHRIHDRSVCGLRKSRHAYMHIKTRLRVRMLRCFKWQLGLTLCASSLNLGGATRPLGHVVMVPAVVCGPASSSKIPATCLHLFLW